MTSILRLRYLVTGLILVGLIIAPFTSRTAGGLLPGPINSPGSLQVLCLVFVAAATAMTLDLMDGYTGLASFGHSLYFAFGAYSTVILSNSPSLGFALGLPLAMILSVIVAVVANVACLRLTGLGFTMATLALAQGFAIGIERGFLGSGGEVGVTFKIGVLPDVFRGLANTKNVYWLALLLVVFVYLLCAALVRTHNGHVWQGIRENPLRANAIGYNVYQYQLVSASIACTLAAVCGAVFAVVMGGANPSIADLHYTLALVLMVVLGGRGTLWGAALGGFLFQFLTLRMPAVAESDVVSRLPHGLQVPLSQPNALLGTAFILVVLFLPGGLASLVKGVGSTRWRRGGDPNLQEGDGPREGARRLRISRRPSSVVNQSSPQ